MWLIPSASARLAPLLDGLQIFDERFLFLIYQTELEDLIVVVNHVEQGSETVVMIEAALVDFLRIEKRA